MTEPANFTQAQIKSLYDKILSQKARIDSLEQENAAKD